MDAESYIKDLLASFWYNRSCKEMKDLCEEMKNRFAKRNCKHTDDGDILYSIIIMTFGEYGTSPRSGWLLKIKPEVVIDTITDFEDGYTMEDEDDI